MHTHAIAISHVRTRTKRSMVKVALEHQNLATTARCVGLVPEQMDKRLQENAFHE